MKLDKFAAISAALVRFSIAGNFLGLPAVTVPVRSYYQFLTFTCIWYVIPYRKLDYFFVNLNCSS